MEQDQIKTKWKRWRQCAVADPDVAAELKEMAQEPEKMQDAFYRDLEFGTGGLRGVIGAGTNRMNLYTVARASQGYADYLRDNFKEPSVAIAYDSRIKSDLFARTAAEVFAANGIRADLYPELMPTPALSFAVRHLHCSGGIVVTASHNPAKYNGYKVYGPDGCQITTKAAAQILAYIERVDLFSGVKRMQFADAVTQGKISYIGEETVAAFLAAVSSQSLCGDEPIDKSVSIVYTPLNGTGLACVTRCLHANGFTNLSVVAEQERPDGNFPTCPYPNPEIREALKLGLRDARKLGSDLLLATDPDCDRVGIAVRTGDDYVLLTGNEVGILLLDYICKRRIALGKMPERPLAVKTIVTTDMAKQVAKHYGVEMVEVLTGFKFIGEQIGILESKGEEDRYILGFEESYGYLTGSYVRDKDAVDGALMICEMFAYYKTHGQSLVEVLDGLYRQYGYCLNTLHSYEFEGSEGFQQMQAVMERFRFGYQPGTSPWLGREILSVSDYQSAVTSYADGHRERMEFPRSNVLKYRLAGGCSVVVRPSGTEPKLKLYLSISAPDPKFAQDLEKRLAGELRKLIEPQTSQS